MSWTTQSAAICQRVRVPRVQDMRSWTFGSIFLCWEVHFYQLKKIMVVFHIIYFSDNLIPAWFQVVRESHLLRHLWFLCVFIVVEFGRTIPLVLLYCYTLVRMTFMDVIHHFWHLRAGLPEQLQLLLHSVPPLDGTQLCRVWQRLPVGARPQWVHSSDLKCRYFTL